LNFSCFIAAFDENLSGDLGLSLNQTSLEFAIDWKLGRFGLNPGMDW
jgi:hypothetical protein